MKYAAIVLAENRDPYASADFFPVTDALLAGGVFLDETVILPYDSSVALSERLGKLSSECDGVFVVCFKSFVPAAKSAVAEVAGSAFAGENVFGTENCLFAVLPSGEEGARIVTTEVVPFVDRRRGNMYCRQIVCTAGAPAEAFHRALDRAREAAEGKLILHVSEKYGRARIEIIYDKNTPKMTADEVVRILATDLSDYVYSLNDESVAERLVQALLLHRMKISVAESFTGGGVGRAIVRVPGASSVYYEGINAYDPAAKTERLGVSEYTLRSKGAVSDETAYEMAAGLLSRGKCDLAIATTGYAGPAAEGSNEPVGLCFLAVGTRERVRVFRYRLSGDRENITETAINLALHHAYREIK